MDEKDKRIAAQDKRIAELEAALSEQIEINRRLILRIAELERRLNLNSSNSGKPPSSDGLGKKPTNPRSKPSPQSLREKGKNPSGGQNVHKGTTLQQVATPGSIVSQTLGLCAHCQADISDMAPIDLKKRQVFDIPRIAITVTQYESEVKVCTHCGGRTTAHFPTGVNAPVQYGGRLKAFAIYLNNQQFIPEDRLQELFTDLFNIPISTTTLAKICNAFGDSLEEFDEQNLESIREAPVKHSDETGFRIGGKTCWLHLLSTTTATHYWVPSKRGDVVKGLTNGVHIHDHYKPYYTQNPKVKHGLCNGHHLRELQACIDIEKEPWATGMKRFLLAASRYQGRDPPPARAARLYEIYDQIVVRGLAFHESLPPLTKGKRGRLARRPGHNLLIRLRDFKDDVLRFLSDKNVSFTNNLAERDVRMMKVRQKISGGFRTMEGAQTFCRIRGFISTMRKQGRNILESIQTALSGGASDICPV
jgi:transposase